MDTREPRFIQITILRLKDGDGGFSNSKERNFPSAEMDVAAVKFKGFAKIPAGGVHVAGYKGDVCQRIAGQTYSSLRATKCIRTPPIIVGCINPMRAARDPGLPTVSIVRWPAALILAKLSSTFGVLKAM